MAYGTINADKVNGIGNASVNDFRLTLTTGVPVTTADVSAAGTIYMTPYKGNSIGCYDGTNWQMVQTTEMSVAASTTGSKVFDIFLDYNAGTPQLVTTDWTSDTARATALTYQDGVLVQTGNTDWRYLGTARTKTASQVDDAEAFRHLWNYYNRVEREMANALETTDSWTYTTATFRQANANTANQLDFVIGVQEDSIEAVVGVSSRNSTLNVVSSVGIGLDSTTVSSAQIMQTANSAVATRYAAHGAEYRGIISAGRHYLAWLEISNASGTCTWGGDFATPTRSQSGIIGSIKC